MKLGLRDPSPSGDEDDQLLMRIAKGDQTAFRSLMERHARPMLSLAQRTLGQAEDADEVVQEAFLKVWTMAAGWQPDGTARFSTWLYRVVLNACIDRKRRKTMAPLDDAGDPVDPAQNSHDHAVARERHALVRDAMGDLPDRQREALSLHYFSELTAPKAAEILGLSVSALEALLVRGKKGLRQALARRGIAGLGDV